MTQNAIFISGIFDPVKTVGVNARAFPEGPESDAYLGWADDNAEASKGMETIEEWTTVEDYIRRHPWSAPFLAMTKPL